MEWIKRMALWLLILAVAVLAVLQFRHRYFSGDEVNLPPRGQFLDIGDNHLYLTVQGDGRPILLLHGFPYHSDLYQRLLAQPWPGFQLITVDFPGLGSSGGRVPDPCTPEDLALIIKLLLDRLELKQVDIVGHDLGGGVALVIAARYPNLVHRLVLLAPDSSGGASGVCRGWWWRLPVVGDIWSWLRLNRSWYRRLLQSSWHAGDNGWEAAVDRYQQPFQDIEHLDTFRRLNRGRFEFHYLPYEERVRTPCLLLWGAQDRIVVPAAAGRLTQLLPNLEYHELPRAGHLLPEEAPETLNALIREFLTVGVDSSSGR